MDRLSVDSIAASTFVGCRAFPRIEALQNAIAVTRDAFRQWTAGPTAQLPAACRNNAILHVLWQQCYAIGHRGTKLPYIPLSAVHRKSGLATLHDKTSATGYKARLVWFPAGLLQDMADLQCSLHSAALEEPARSRRATAYPYFVFDDGSISAETVSRQTFERVSHEFFPFPLNTPRRVMRHLLTERGLAPEYVDVFMGHWRERREPWGRWSGFDYSEYLRRLRQTMPDILRELGF
jgi:hypothetical protein